MVTGSINFEQDVNPQLKKLLEELYPNPTETEIKKLDQGTIIYNYKMRTTEVRGENDKVVSNAEIVKFLVNTGHEAELNRMGWTVPFYFKILPKGISPKTGILEEDIANFRNYVWQSLPSDTDDCKVESTAEEAIRSGCYACSELSYIFQGLGTHHGLRPQPIGMWFNTEGKIVDHIGLYFAQGTTHLYVDNNTHLSATTREKLIDSIKKTYELDGNSFFGIFDDVYTMCGFFVNRSHELSSGTGDFKQARRDAKKAIALCPWLGVAHSALSHTYEVEGDYVSAHAIVKKQHAIHPFRYSRTNMILTGLKASLFHISVASSYAAGLTGNRVDGLGLTLGINYGRNLFVGLEVELPIHSLPHHKVAGNFSLRGGYRTFLSVTGVGELEHSTIEIYGLGGALLLPDRTSFAAGAGITYALGWNTGYSLFGDIRWSASSGKEVDHTLQLSLGIMLHL